MQIHIPLLHSISATPRFGLRAPPFANASADNPTPFYDCSSSQCLGNLARLPPQSLAVQQEPTPHWVADGSGSTIWTDKLANSPFARFLLLDTCLWDKYQATKMLRSVEALSYAPNSNRMHGRVLFDDILLATDFDHHALHLVRDLVVLFLHVASGVAMHLGARSRHVMERSGRTQKTCGYVSCQVNDEDKACCRLQRRLWASMAAQRRLLMGPNEKLLKNARKHEESPPTLVYFLLTSEKKIVRLIRDITPQRSLLLLNTRERGRVSGYPFIVTSVAVLLRLGEHRIGLGIASFAMCCE